MVRANDSMSGQVSDLGTSKGQEEVGVFSGKAHSTGGEAGSVDLSLKAQNMPKVKKLARGRDIDEAKVKHLQKLIDSEKYEVDATAVAECLLKSHLGLPE